MILGIRPQDIRGRTNGAQRATDVEVQVEVVEDLGSATHLLFTIDAPPVDTDSVVAATDEPERAMLIATDRRALFTAELAEGADARPGGSHSIRLVSISSTP